ncbi:MAG TPA: Gfo/Idh/MocA family oxidoreductase [Thermoguttaceae bacterium]|nr:Gfo/Idh/MocA family oxidoreductase [Thermoguttaceae bacterium]
MSRKITRRQAIRTTLGAIAAPMIVDAATLGLAEAAPASERITLGFIGTGKMANDYHLSTLPRYDDTHTLAVCDVSEARCKNAKRRVDAYEKRKNSAYGGCDMTDDFRKIIERDDIDAVCIATPEHWHTIPLLSACIAGKDVYCEKPLTLTLRESQLCIEAARKYKRVVQTGSQQRSSVFGPFRQACEIVRSGRLGKISKVTVGVGSSSKWCDLPEEEMEPGLNWDMWLGQAPVRPYNSALSPRGVHNHFPAWRAYREYAGGGLADMGAHHFDIAQWALDMDESGPVAVHPPEDPTAKTGAKVVYANGIEVYHGGPSGCTFTGTEGTMYINRGHLSSDPEAITKEPIADNEVHLFESRDHHRNWLDCVKSRQRPVAEVEVGARSVAVCHLLNLAYWNRRSYTYDPKNWCFDNETDNQDLDRERRDPWQLPVV